MAASSCPANNKLEINGSKNFTQQYGFNNTSNINGNKNKVGHSGDENTSTTKGNENLQEHTGDRNVSTIHGIKHTIVIAGFRIDSNGEVDFKKVECEPDTFDWTVGFVGKLKDGWKWWVTG